MRNMMSCLAEWTMSELVPAPTLCTSVSPASAGDRPRAWNPCSAIAIALPMANQKPAWQVMLPGGKASAAYSLDELRAAKQVHSFLTENVPGPGKLAHYIRAFRY